MKYFMENINKEVMLMTGIATKKFTTVIMDGSNLTYVMGILKWIEYITESQRNTYIYKVKGYESFIFIDTMTDENSYETIKFVIEDLYPGLCVFNPQM